eukprot:4192071-Heterocapsa_arctica.AAC.1
MSLLETCSSHLPLCRPVVAVVRSCKARCRMLADVADQSVLATRPAAWPTPSRRRRAIASRHDVSYR